MHRWIKAGLGRGKAYLGKGCTLRQDSQLRRLDLGSWRKLTACENPSGEDFKESIYSENTEHGCSE